MLPLFWFLKGGQITVFPSRSLDLSPCSCDVLFAFLSWMLFLMLFVMLRCFMVAAFGTHVWQASLVYVIVEGFLGICACETVALLLLSCLVGINIWKVEVR